MCEIGDPTVDQHIGLEETENGIWAIQFNTVCPATFLRARLHHYRLTQVSPMFPGTCVTHHPDCSRRLRQLLETDVQDWGQGAATGAAFDMNTSRLPQAVAGAAYAYIILAGSTRR